MSKTKKQPLNVDTERVNQETTTTTNNNDDKTTMTNDDDEITQITITYNPKEPQNINIISTSAKPKTEHIIVELAISIIEQIQKNK